MSRAIIIFFILFTTLGTVKGQLNNEYGFVLNNPRNKAMISVFPQGLFQNSLRIDADFKLFSTYWLQIAAQYNSCEENEQKGSFEGGGINVNLRWYPENIKSFYFAWGMGFEMNKVSGLSAVNQHPSQIFYLVNTSRLGGHFNVGYLFQIFERTVLDFYAGFGYKVAFYQFPDLEKKIEMRNFRSSSLNYSGIVFQLGVRLGFIL